VAVSIYPVRDDCSGRVIGWPSSAHVRRSRRVRVGHGGRHAGRAGQTVIVHADRGCQYTGAQLARFAPPAQSDPFTRAYLACAGTALPPNHSGRHLKSSSTTDTWGPPYRPQGRRRRLDRANPVSAKHCQAQGTLVLVVPQPLRQIFERDQHNRIIATHQCRRAHLGPHRPTLTMPKLQD
jgi:hypothetical protein